MKGRGRWGGVGGGGAAGAEGALLGGGTGEPAGRRRAPGLAGAGGTGGAGGGAWPEVPRGRGRTRGGGSRLGAIRPGVSLGWLRAIIPGAGGGGVEGSAQWCRRLSQLPSPLGGRRLALRILSSGGARDALRLVPRGAYGGWALLERGRSLAARYRAGASFILEAPRPGRSAHDRDDLVGGLHLCEV